MIKHSNDVTMIILRSLKVLEIIHYLKLFSQLIGYKA